MSTLSRKFIAPISRLKYEDIPKEVVEITKACIIHQLACCCAGRRDTWTRAAHEIAKDFGYNGKSVIWFSDLKGDAFEATLVNSVTAMSILQEDIHREGGLHAGIVIIPAAFAMGEALDRSGKDVLTSIVAGYELMCKIGKGVADPEFNSRGFRPTTIMGPIGSSFTAGLLMGLTEDQLVSACGIAGNFSCGINEWAASGTDEVFFQNGVSTANGIIAAYAAQKGIKSPEKIFEGTAGLCNAYGISREILEKVDPYDGVYEISRVMFKSVPCCNLTHTTAHLAMKAVKAGIDPDSIEKGVIITNSRAKAYAGNDYPGPFHSAIKGRMSQQYTFAGILVHKNTSNQTFLDFSNPKTGALAAKLTVETDPNYDAVYPDKMSGAVELYLKDGSKKRFELEEAIYMNSADIVNGMYTYLTEVMAKSTVDKIVDIIDHFEKVKDIKELTRLLQVK